MKLTYTYKLLTIALSLSLTLVASCSSDGPEGNGSGEGTRFSIFTRSESVTSDLSTSYGKPDETHPQELIQNWTVAFIRQNDGENDGEIVEVIRSKTASANEPVMSEDFIPHNLSGKDTYTIVAFANMDPPNVNEVSIAEGNKIDLTNLEKQMHALKNNPFGVGEGLVPMTGIRKGVVIQDNDEISAGHNGKRNAVEVIRMFAKIEIKVRNISSKDMTLKKVSFGTIVGKETDDVPLFPDYEKLDNEAKSLRASDTSGSDPETPGASESSNSIVRTEPGITIPHGEVGNVLFYVRESNAVHPTGRFFITLTFAGSDGNEIKEHYAIADELESINRNDHIIIPVTFSDLTVDWEVLFYPPIGGYPAVTENAEGDSHFFTFMTQGKFVIRPMVRNADGTPYPVSGYEFTIKSVTDPDRKVTYDTSKPAGIFKKIPAINDAGEIIGELGTGTGTAILECTLEFDTGTTPDDHFTRTRNIYIIRK